MTRQIERESETPPCRQLYEILRNEIRAGAIVPGAAFPSLTCLMRGVRRRAHHRA